MEDYNKDFISIDPENSIDIDDGFYLDYPILDIIIACPTYYLDENDIIKKYNESVSSRYYSKTNHLWGEEINSKASLLKNSKTVLMIMSYNLVSKKYEISFKYGENKNQVSYEYADKYLIENFSKLKLHFKFENSKELVQEIMILANKKYTEYMRENNLLVLYRDFSVNKDFEKLKVPKEIKNIFNQRKSDSAKYTMERREHELMEGEYSHFTSPLRRWVDCFHQLVILNNIMGKRGDYKIDEKKLNLKFDKIKKFHREYNYYCENRKYDFTKKYKGYIFNVRLNLLDVYCPEISRFIKVEFINKKLLFQLQIHERDNKWCIYDKINDYGKIYELGEIIEFELKKTDILIPSKRIIGYLA